MHSHRTSEVAAHLAAQQRVGPDVPTRLLVNPPQSPDPQANPDHVPGGGPPLGATPAGCPFPAAGPQPAGVCAT